MYCSKHLEKDAAGACTYCGKFFCSDCLIEVNGRMYCRDDIGKVMNEVKESAKNQPAPMVFMNAGGAAASSSSSSAAASGSTAVPTTTKNRMLAAILALFLGGLGIHKFYLGETMKGVLFLIFCWTFIPALIALFNFIGLLIINDQKFAAKYPG